IRPAGSGPSRAMSRPPSGVGSSDKDTLFSAEMQAARRQHVPARNNDPNILSHKRLHSIGKIRGKPSFRQKNPREAFRTDFPEKAYGRGCALFSGMDFS